jgi:Flp pilus assembly protein CpaB
VNRKKSTGIIASAALAVFGILLLVMFVKGRGSDAEAKVKAAAAPVEPMKNVWVAQADIPKGASGDSIMPLLKLEPRPESQVPAGADADVSFKIDNIKGKLTNAPILKTSVINDALFESTADATAAALPPGKLAVTMILPGDRMAGVGKLPNETVGVVASFAGIEGGNVTHLLLHKVQIIGRPTPYGGVAPTTVAGQVDQGPNSFIGQVQITLAVDAHDAERLIYINQFGIIHLIQEPLTAKEEGTDLTKIENIYAAVSGNSSAGKADANGPTTTIAKPDAANGAAGPTTKPVVVAPAPAPSTVVAAAAAPTTIKK